jgi:hypothetical protein
VETSTLTDAHEEVARAGRLLVALVVVGSVACTSTPMPERRTRFVAIGGFDRELGASTARCARNGPP